MTVALAIGIAISSRTISTVRRTTNIDTSSRALSAAEAAAEFYLSQTPAQLDSPTTTGFANPNDNITNCDTMPADLSVKYPPANGSIGGDLTTTANVRVRRVGCINNAHTTPVTFSVDNGKVFELKLNPIDNVADLTISVPGSAPGNHNEKEWL